MEDLKQEAIKKAYGEHYEKCSPDENGWTKYSYCTNESIGIFDLYVDFTDNHRRIESELWRPKSLSELESNNGWVRILEDGSNLPKEYCSCWVMIGKVIVNTPAYFNPFSQTFTDNLVQQYYTRFTNYQKIETPKPPIY